MLEEKRAAAAAAVLHLLNVERPTKAQRARAELVVDVIEDRVSAYVRQRVVITALESLARRLRRGEALPRALDQLVRELEAQA